MNKNESTIHTCPRHFEIKKDEPGNCPICGIALETINIKTESQRNSEYKKMLKRLIFAIIFSTPIMFLAMYGYLLTDWISIDESRSIQLFLTLIVILGSGGLFFHKGWQSIKSLHLNMFAIISLSTGATFIYSIAASLFPEMYPDIFKSAEGIVNTYFEVAAIMTIIMLLGRTLELRSKEKNNNSITSLYKLAPETANRINADGSETKISINDIKIGNLLKVHPFEKVPVDGVIIEGQSSINESMITGEHIPINKTAGSKVDAATINQNGSFIMQALHVGNNTMLAHIIKMVSNAERSHAPIQRLADVVASFFLPIVLIIALISFFSWLIFGPEPSLSYAIISFISVLIISCPCALSIAAPMSIMIGISHAAKNDVIIKDAAALEIMGKIDVLMSDKTGTLTKGHQLINDILQDDDPIKPNTNEAIKILQNCGIKIIMLSGDKEDRANQVAEQLGIKDVFAKSLPEDKIHLLTNLQNEGKIVAMIGDGINDSPAIAKADVGIAMGNGSEVAIESADIILHGDFKNIIKLYQLSKATIKNIRQNLFFALIYNVIGIPVAAGLLYPFTHILLHPMMVVCAMLISSACIMLNSLRIKNVAFSKFNDSK